ncbi:MAG: NAD(P)H-hydrate dehydratase [Lactobacillales bacterium]|nr:NAD(P)H-hydrate dehydratase [Lactobacillales bacterium]
MKTLTIEILRKVIQPRPENSHKGTFGRALLIGGNEQFGGAILMAAKACVYSGAGLTTVITHEKNHAPLHTLLPEAMVIDNSNEKKMIEAIQQAEVLLIGSGLGKEEKSLKLLQLVLSTIQKNQFLIIDGDAITLIAEHHLLIPYPWQTIYTPHEMEWQRLSGLPIAEQTVEASLEKAKEIGSLIVQKSHRTKIYTCFGDVYELPIGTPAMATGGMGDTLAGMITGFLTQFRQNPIKSVCAAAYLHSYIAEELALTQYVVLPTQISERIPTTMKKFSE